LTPKKTKNKGESPKQTIQRFVDFLKAEGKAEGTIEAYERTINHLNKETNKPFKTITRRNLETYLASWREQQTSKSYMNFIRTVLKYFFKWLYGKETYPTCVKWIKTKTIKREIDPREILTEKEVYQLIRAAENERDRALIHVLFETGGRINEIRKLDVRDVIFEMVGDKEPVLTAKLMISQERTKGKEKGKYLRLIDSAEALKTWLETHPNPEADKPLWVSLHSHFGSQLHVSTIRRMLKRLAKKCGITKPVNPHNFRHSQVTASAQYLADQELKKKFGWTADSRMLQVYSHITDQAVEEKELQMRGVTEIKHKQKRILTHVKCDQCGRVYSAGQRICECGRPLDPDLAKLWDQEQVARKEKEKKMTRIFQLMSILPDETLNGIIDVLEKKLEKE